jgi:transcriptional regulator with XRE-family HTH domain
LPRRNSRDPQSDPAAAFGEALGRLREAAGFTTQEAAAARLNYGHDTISRWETGAVVPDEAQIARVLDAYAVTGVARENTLTMWRLARKAKGPIREFFAKYFEEEQEAAFLRMFGLLMIPGGLQTREYAHAMFLEGGLDEDEAAEQTELRMKRRARVDGPDPAHVTALIHERALYFRVGTSETMIEQLADLLELSRRQNVVLQVIPDEGYFPGVAGAFEIASRPGISDIVDQVTVVDYVTDDPAVVGKVIARFAKVHGYARNVAESRTLISEAITFWQSQQK